MPPALWNTEAAAIEDVARTPRWARPNTSGLAGRTAGTGGLSCRPPNTGGNTDPISARPIPDGGTFAEYMVMYRNSANGYAVW